MTELLLTGDNHLGKGQDLGRVPGERLAEQEAVWAATLALARERHVDAVIHAGDLFDGRRPGPDVMLAAERPLVEHQVKGGATVYVIVGNHDVPSQDGACGLDVLAEARLIELAREPRTWTVGDVDVCALPWTPVSRLVAANDGGDRAEISALAADLLLETARGMKNEDRTQILLGHWSVSQTSLPNGLDVGTLGGVVLPMDHLQAIGFDHIIFGHIHLAANYEGDFVYVGSPQPLDFGEGGSRHGVWILDADAAAAGDPYQPVFVPLASRSFVTLEQGVDLTTLPPLDGSFVKVRGTMSDEDHRRFDVAACRERLELHGAYSVTFDLTIEREHRDRGHVLVDGQTRLEQLAAYLAATGTNGSVGAAMLAKAEELIS